MDSIEIGVCISCKSYAISNYTGACCVLYSSIGKESKVQRKFIYFGQVLGHFFGIYYFLTSLCMLIWSYLDMYIFKTIKYVDDLAQLPDACIFSMLFMFSFYGNKNLLT